MDKDRIWTLLSRKLSGEATFDEIQELNNSLQEQSGESLHAKVVEEYWELCEETDKDFLEATYLLHSERLREKGFDLNEFNTETGLLNLPVSEESSLKNKWIKPVFFLTAMLAIFAILFFTNSQTQVTTEKTVSEVSTKNGSRSKMTLPDGTQVWLNSNTKLIYSIENFAKGKREVTLTGEAYFDVVKNEEHPFLIHANNINIKVLGTAFNVKAYLGEKTTETSLIRGSVEVTVNDRQEKIIMKPNEKLIINNDDNGKPGKQDETGKLTAPLPKKKESLLKPQPIIELSHLTLYPLDNSVVETGWVENRLVFSGETLENIAIKMERWYGVTIVIEDEALQNQLITGSFTEETVQQALQALQISTPFAFKMEKNIITISKLK